MIEVGLASPLADVYGALCAAGRCSDKGTTHSYIPFYEELFAEHRQVRARVLELGVFNGHSLELWAGYFTDGQVWGVDLSPVQVVPQVGMLVGDCTDPGVVGRLPGGWDVVIDDASHRVQDQIGSFLLLAPKLAPGGLYVIEDVQSDGDRVAIEAATGVPWQTVDLRHIRPRYDDLLLVYRA